MGSIDYSFNPLAMALGVEATFVARTQDTNTKHLSEILRRAAEHKGAAFVEIYQNCVVYNPTAWAHTTDPNVRDDNILFLEDGKPLVFGKDHDKGIRMNGFVPEVVQMGNGISESELLIHSDGRENSSYAYMLSRMEHPQFPLPFGVLRAVQKPTYTDMLSEQVEQSAEKSGAGDLSALFHSSDTWEVE